MRWQELLGSQWNMEGKDTDFENPERWYIYGDFVSIPFIENDFGGRQTAVAIEQWGNLPDVLMMEVYSDWGEGVSNFHRVFPVERLPEIESTIRELVYLDSSLVELCLYIDKFQDDMGSWQSFAEVE